MGVFILINGHARKRVQPAIHQLPASAMRPKPRLKPSCGFLLYNESLFLSGDENGFVKPGTGGMSVAPNSVWNIPNHRRPRGMRMGSAGKIADRIYALTDAAVRVDKLTVRRDPKRPEMHAFVEPAVMIALAGYEGCDFMRA
jgi:hypothetical protein